MPISNANGDIAACKFSIWQGVVAGGGRVKVMSLRVPTGPIGAISHPLFLMPFNGLRGSRAVIIHAAFGV